ncbi:MAG: MFS transporter [Chitinophagaceae bacterium]|jgi:FHS family L-fucose permease-like MFS transporter|nr:MFS transporter [Sphingobacteriales bacterium]OJW03600.1 MAG: MFS transporter [Sphingobacteriales bacterium 44-61]TXJ22993.1 MAG: MFS transporter [Chitinophagaceae bacterium]
MNQQTKWSQFGTLVTVFFFWGFVAASNDILIPVFKENLHLSQAQSQLVSFAFYVAYTVGSLIYFGISKARGGDILNQIGYRNGISLGLIISALGTLLFYPAAQTSSFPLFISGLFIVGLGFSLQQTAANPLAIIMGNPKSGAQRLSMAGGINNFGTTIGPLIVSFAIFGSVTGGTATASIQSIKIPYLILGLAFVIVAVIFRFSSVPNKIELDKVAEDEASDSRKVAHRSGPLKYPQLLLGMLGIFIYVGVEVSTAANLPEFMKEHLNTPTDKIAPYVSLYWASLMIGRWTASVGAFDISKGAKQILRFLMPYIAFGVFILVNTIANHDVTPFFIYAAVILVIIIGDILSKGNPARQLLIFSLLGITALLIGILADGMISVYAFISVGLFCSTLWPCIFTLAIAGLGKHTNEGASFLIMMIMGGGIISLLQGVLASNDLLGIQWSYIVGVLCFTYLAFYAWKVKGILKDQGIDYDAEVSVSGGGH